MGQSSVEWGKLPFQIFAGDYLIRNSRGSGNFRGADLESSRRVGRPSFLFVRFRYLDVVLGVSRLVRKFSRTDARECEGVTHYNFARIIRDRAVGFFFKMFEALRKGNRVLGILPVGLWQENYHKYGRTIARGSFTIFSKCTDDGDGRSGSLSP